MRLLLAASLLLALPTSATTQTGTDTSAADTSATDPSGTGVFVHHPRRDADGSDRSLVATTSAGGLLVLAWQCTPTGMRILTALGWRWAGNADNDIFVSYRFSPDSADTETLWRLANPGTVAWMRIGDIAAFTTSALASDSVMLSLTDPFDNESRSAVFRLRGLQAALELLECDLRRPSEPEPPG